MRRRGGATPWREGRYLVVDLETTGLDARRAEIISFGAVPVDHGRVQVGAAVHGLVRPRQPPPGETVRIHGLREADLAAAPHAREALRPLREALDGRVAVAHAAWFDGAFLRRQEGLWRRLFRRRWIDTITLARLPDDAARGADAEAADAAGARARGSACRPARATTRLGDAFTTSQAFVALATLLDARAPADGRVAARRARGAARRAEDARPGRGAAGRAARDATARGRATHRVGGRRGPERPAQSPEAADGAAAGASCATVGSQRSARGRYQLRSPSSASSRAAARRGRSWRRSARRRRARRRAASCRASSASRRSRTRPSSRPPPR